MDTFTAEFNATLLQYHGNSSSTYFCGDYNIDLLKIPMLQMYEDYFKYILLAGYIPTIILPTRLSNNSTNNNEGNSLLDLVQNISPDSEDEINFFIILYIIMIKIIKNVLLEAKLL